MLCAQHPIACVQKQQDDVVKKAQMAFKHLQGKAAEAQREAQAKHGNDRQLQQDLDSKRRAVEDAERAHAAIEFDQARFEQVQQICAKQRREVQQLRAQQQQAGASIGSVVDFNFSSPHANFDRSTVRGILARLVQIKNSKHAVALEVAAGAKLHHLVVNTEQVGMCLAH